jgi:predicted alpha/beta hydrolase family esterase
VSAYLILHGLGGSGPGHWQSWLARRLELNGSRVSFPDLPDPDDPQPAVWLEALRPELAHGQARERVVLCHSLACLLWLRAVAAADDPLADRVLLVAPPWRDDLAPIARFLAHGAGPADVARGARETLLVCSDSDPYCPPGAVESVARPLRIPAVVVPGSGHLNPETGFGPWPAVEAWATGDASALRSSGIEEAPSPGPLP